MECLLYGAESSKLKKNDEKMLQPFEVWIWRRYLISIIVIIIFHNLISDINNNNNLSYISRLIGSVSKLLYQ